MAKRKIIKAWEISPAANAACVALCDDIRRAMTGDPGAAPFWEALARLDAEAEREREQERRDAERERGTATD